MGGPWVERTLDGPGKIQSKDFFFLPLYIYWGWATVTVQSDRPLTPLGFPSKLYGWSEEPRDKFRNQLMMINSAAWEHAKKIEERNKPPILGRVMEIRSEPLRVRSKKKKKTRRINSTHSFVTYNIRWFVRADVISKARYTQWSFERRKC